MQQEIKDLKQKYHIKSSLEQPQQKSPNNSQIDKSFQSQIPVSDNHYKIPINVNIKNKRKPLNSSNSTAHF